MLPNLNIRCPLSSFDAAVDRQSEHCSAPQRQSLTVALRTATCCTGCNAQRIAPRRAVGRATRRVASVAPRRIRLQVLQRQSALWCATWASLARDIAAIPAMFPGTTCYDSISSPRVRDASNGQAEDSQTRLGGSHPPRRPRAA
jgi:hypothetical protein